MTVKRPYAYMSDQELKQFQVVLLKAPVTPGNKQKLTLVEKELVIRKQESPTPASGHR